LAVVQVQVPQPVGALAARVVGVAPVVVFDLDVRVVDEARGLGRVGALDLNLVGVGHAHRGGHQPALMWIFPSATVTRR
jgi:hypothetical protein